ncbi:conjugal transfer protein TraF [Serratia fonticola]
MKTIELKGCIFTLAVVLCLLAFMFGAQQAKRLTAKTESEITVLINNAIQNPTHENMSAYIAAQTAIIERAAIIANAENARK